MLSLFKDYRLPIAVSADEIGLSSIKVTIVIPGLKKKKNVNAAANGNVMVEFGTRNLVATIELSTEKYQYTVNKLHAEINPEKSSYIVKNNTVVLFLEKVNPITWVGYIENGLETEVEPS